MSNSLQPYGLSPPGSSVYVISQARILAWIAIFFSIYVYQFSSVAQSCLTLCDPMDCSMPGFLVHHYMQLHVASGYYIGKCRYSTFPSSQEVLLKNADTNQNLILHLHSLSQRIYLLAQPQFVIKPTFSVLWLMLAAVLKTSHNLKFFTPPKNQPFQMLSSIMWFPIRASSFTPLLLSLKSRVIFFFVFSLHLLNTYQR